MSRLRSWRKLLLYNHRDILGIELNLFFKDKIIKSWKKLLLNNRQTLRNKKIPKMWGDFFFKCKTMLHVKPYSMSLPFGIMRNIWVYLLLLGETGQHSLLKLKNGYGVICNVGRKSCCLKLVGRL